jgi:hypothetical protein
MIAICALVGFSAPAVFAPSAEATGASSWAAQVTPNPAGAQEATLAGVSCSSRMFCTAVGHFTNAAGTGLTLAERSNGNGWSIQPTVDSPGAASSLLFGVSCPSRDVCTAVGSVTDRSGTLTIPLVERWTGERWSVQRSPSPTRRSPSLSYLGGVSCTSPRFCAAVGYSGNRLGTSGRAQIYQWNGKRWSIQPTPRLPDASVGFLSGVSCTSPRNCTATGFYVPHWGPGMALAEHWDGAMWSIERAPNPDAATGVQLVGLSCTRRGPCTTVGFFTVGTGIEVMFAERWSGMSWSVQHPPYPAGATGVQLGGVSCPESRACAAVGFFTNASGRDDMLAERWDGSRWSIEPIAAPSGTTSNSLADISCVSTRACTAVGESIDAGGTGVTLAERRS